MRRLKFSTVLLLTSIMPAYAATPIDGLYSSAFGGAAFLPGNVDVTSNNVNLTQSAYDAGFDVGGALGYKSAFWRYEAEVTYIHAQMKKIAVNNIVSNANSNAYNQDVTAMINLAYDLPYNPSYLIQPYIGAGMGYAWVQTNFTTPNQFSFNATNYAFAYQGTAGLTFHFSENYSLYAGYRYLGTTHLDKNGSIFQANLVNAGITYRYDSCEYK